MTMCSAESTAADPGIGGGSIGKIPDTTNRNPNRRSNKPIMEKRRRARINNCLNELKGILLEAMRKDPARHSKLEKADILELTVSHLKALHRQHGHGHGTMSTTDGLSRFRAGFSECAAEVSRFLSTITTTTTTASTKCQSGIQSGNFDQTTSARLLSHLSDCLNNSNLMSNSNSMSVSMSVPMSMSMSMTRTNQMDHLVSTDHFMHHHPLSVVPPNTPVISLVPSRLSSGEIAFVVPATATALSRTSSSSSSSCPSSTSTTSITIGTGTFLTSDEVPLELTVPSSSSSASSSSSSGALSGCSLSPNFQLSTSGHNYNRGHGYGHGHGHGLGLGHIPFSSSQPLALVTPKKETLDGLDTNPSTWRPW